MIRPTRRARDLGDAVVRRTTMLVAAASLVGTGAFAATQTTSSTTSNPVGVPKASDSKNITYRAPVDCQDSHDSNEHDDHDSDEHDDHDSDEHEDHDSDEHEDQAECSQSFSQPIAPPAAAPASPARVVSGGS